MNKIFIIFFLILNQAVTAQSSKERIWGFSLTPGFSKGKNPHGYVVSYGPNFVDFRIVEPAQFVIHGEAFLKKQRGRYSITKTAGMSGYNYYDKFEYDPSTTGTNYLWGKRSFIFLSGGYKIGREFTIGKLAVVPEAGISFDYLIRAKYYSEYKGGYTYQNILPQMKRANYGVLAAVKLKVHVDSKFDFQLGPYLKQLIRSYQFPSDKKLYFYGLAVELIIKPKSTLRASQ